jgi:hypothetical protein
MLEPAWAPEFSLVERRQPRGQIRNDQSPGASNLFANAFSAASTANSPLGLTRGSLRALRDPLLKDKL